jgi:hypothetical protein
MSATRPASSYAHTGGASGATRAGPNYAGSAGSHLPAATGTSHAGAIVSRTHSVAGAESSRSAPGSEATHGPSTETKESRPGEAAGASKEAGSHDASGDRAGSLTQADHRPPSVGVTRTPDGHVKLVTAGPRGEALEHPEDRAFLHADARPGAVRDRAAVDRDRDFIRAHDGDFRDRDVRRFDARELGLWRGGLWRNEWHYGRRGWWWEAGGAWYPYGAPIFPFPLVVAALVAYDTAVVDGPDIEGDQLGPSGGTHVNSAGEVVPYDASTAATDIPPLPAPPAGSYRCSQPDGYYPYVGYCGSDWSLVQEAPPDAAADGTPAAP